MTVTEGLIYLLTMIAAGIVAALLYPLVVQTGYGATRRVEALQRLKVQRSTQALDEIFMEVPPRWLMVAYGVGPVAAGVGAFLLSSNVAVAVVGAVLGFLVPDLWIKQTRALRLRKFRGQLVDALFVLSSSLRAGLSLTQAFEQLESEMPPPASQEFGLMVKANRLGRSLEDSLNGLKRRMPCEELELVTTAVLVSRETGGDVTGIIGQLITTIRERKKLLDKISTLTLQGRFQAYLMSLIPILFAVYVRSTNPDYFDILLHDPIGIRFTLAAIGFWIVAVFFVFRLSRLEF